MVRRSQPNKNVLLASISRGILESSYWQNQRKKTTIFICGKSLIDENSIRAKVAQLFQKGTLSYRYSMMFPETIFEELLSGRGAIDLLSLENMLANVVDIVIVILESPGAIAELGAFANHKRIAQKIVVLQDQRFQRNKSFINVGPVQFLKRKLHRPVVYFRPEDFTQDSQELTAFRRRLTNAISSGKDQQLELRQNKSPSLNLLNVDRFLLPCLFLLDAPSRETLEEVVLIAGGKKNAQVSRTAVAAGLTQLRRDGHIKYASNGFDYRGRRVEPTSYGVELTASGIQLFQESRRRRRSVYIPGFKSLDKLRALVMKARYA